MQELSTKNVSIGVVGSDRSFEIIENDSLEPFFTLAMAEEVRAVLQIDTFVGVMFALIGLWKHEQGEGESKDDPTGEVVMTDATAGDSWAASTCHWYGEGIRDIKRRICNNSFLQCGPRQKCVHQSNTS